jgi:hypothetical protein
VAKYQNTSNLENHYITTGTDHEELADRMTSMHHIDRQERLGSAADGRISLSRTFVAPAFTVDKKSRCDIKFVEDITSRCCGTPCERLQFPNIILKDRRL